MLQNIIPKVQAAQLSMGQNYWRYGNSDPGNCDTVLTAMDTNLNRYIIIGGWTKSATKIRGFNRSQCLPKQVGYVTLYDTHSQQIKWEKFFLGNKNWSSNQYVEEV